MKWLEPVGARVIPCNFGPLRGFNAHGRIEGSCGDTMEAWLRLDGTLVRQASFITDGCATAVLAAVPRPILPFWQDGKLLELAEPLMKEAPEVQAAYN